MLSSLKLNGEFPPRLTSQSETIFNGLKLLHLNNHFAVFFYAETMSFLVELQRVSNLDEFCLHVNDTFEFTGSDAEAMSFTTPKRNWRTFSTL